MEFSNFRQYTEICCEGSYKQKQIMLVAKHTYIEQNSLKNEKYFARDHR